MNPMAAVPHPNDLPILRFPGEIRMVNRPEDVGPMARDLGREPMLGFDTETRPTFVKGQKHLPALVQLAASDRAYIIQLRCAGFREELISLLSNPRILKLGVGIRDDLAALQQLVPFMPQGFVDLGDLAKSKGIAQRGARSLTARFLQGRISKAMQTSNWAARELSNRQKIYAATDAWVCLCIYPLLRDEPGDADPRE
jgi:ribonuclease D